MNVIAQASPAPLSGPALDNRRVMAAIVDLLIVTAGAVVVLFAGDSLAGDRQGALVAVIVGWALYYFFALESGGGQTLGKRLMKLRVMCADGRPAGMREVGVRTILRVVDNYLVGLIVMLATGERRQRIGDLAAGTIVVDASGRSVAPRVPAADPVEVDHEPADAEPEPVANETITLPPRPMPSSTAADRGDPAQEAPPVPELRPFPPVEEPAGEEPAVEVAEEPAAEVAEEPAVEDEELPAVTSPSLEELAEDVATAHSEPEVEELPQDEEPVTVKSVETVSAMDMIMGAAEDESAGEHGADSARDSEDSATQ